MDSATKINVKTIQRDQPQAIAEFQEVFVGLQSILELIVDEKGEQCLRPCMQEDFS